MNRIVSTEFNTTNYKTVEYAVKGGKLPAGVTLEKDGTLKGTPTEAGTYTVVVEMTATKTSSGGGGFPGGGGGPMMFGGFPGGSGGSTTQTTKVDYTITFVVAGDGQTPAWTENVPYIGENGNWFVNGVDTGKPSQGAAGTNGTDGKDGKGGCSSTVTGVAGIVGMTFVLAAGTICLLKKRKED